MGIHVNWCYLNVRWALDWSVRWFRREQGYSQYDYWVSCGFVNRKGRELSHEECTALQKVEYKLISETRCQQAIQIELLTLKWSWIREDAGDSSKEIWESYKCSKIPARKAVTNKKLQVHIHYIYPYKTSLYAECKTGTPWLCFV